VPLLSFLQMRIALLLVLKVLQISQDCFLIEQSFIVVVLFGFVAPVDYGLLGKIWQNIFSQNL